MSDIQDAEIASETPHPEKSKHQFINEQAFETAAVLFGTYKPHYERLVDKLSKKNLIKLNKALVEYPLNEKDFIHSTSSKELKEAFATGIRLMEAKLTMQLSLGFEAERKNHEEQQAAEAKQKEELDVSNATL